MRLDEQKVVEVLSQGKIDDVSRKIIELRLGLNGNKVHTDRELSKAMKLRGKKLAEAIQKSDKIIFNLLKLESIYDIIIQQNKSDDGD